MRHVIFAILLALPMLTYSQNERKFIREGFKAYMEEDYSNAEINFRKAEETGKQEFISKYNTSAAMYQQQNLEEAGNRFNELLAQTDDPDQQAKLLHNIGNVLTESQQYAQAIEAYKQSLRINPGDDDTRYNLAYALEKLQEQQQQQQNQDNQDQQNQDQQNQQQQQENQEGQEQDNQQQQKDQEQDSQQQQEQNQEEQDQQEQEQQPTKQEMSKEEAERLLNAILQKEKKVKEDVDKKKAATSKIRTDKDW